MTLFTPIEGVFETLFIRHLKRFNHTISLHLDALEKLSIKDSYFFRDRNDKDIDSDHKSGDKQDRVRT